MARPPQPTRAGKGRPQATDAYRRQTGEAASTADWIARQADQDTLRFITCGSVDDGKSTLIGRLLWECRELFEDQLAALAQDSKKHGTQGEALDFALLVDGLVAEREQGITIDVAYRFFATQRRKFIIADTPGHEQYTRNMVTGASTADLAIVLVNAQHGLLPQTRRHAFIAHLMGIRQVVLAINKMDMVGFDHARFHRISEDFEHFARDLNFSQITPIPLSALKGDNITERSGQMPWYRGPTLLGWLETVAIERQATAPFALPIQSVSRPTSDFRGFMGSVASGQVQPGDTVRVTRSGQTAQVRRLVTADGDLDTARQGDAITLTLDKEIDASRGDVLSLAQAPLQTSDQFEATLVWMHEDHGMVGRTYDLKLATQWAGATVTAIKHRVDIHHQLAHEAARQMDLNDMCVCNLALSKPISFRPYSESQALGGFILVDRFTHATVAAGMLHHSLRRADNIHRQALSITREDRERLNGHPGKVIWFTGLSGSGKSTVANALEQALHQQGLRTYILDGDNVRHGLNRDLGFTDADRVENIRRVAEVARLMADAGLIVLTAFISPFRQERRMARELIGPSRFVEVFMDTPLAVCEQRDPKGLYRKARQGQLPNFTGIDSAYEPPEGAEVVIMSDKPLPDAVEHIMAICPFDWAL